MLLRMNTKRRSKPQSIKENIVNEEFTWLFQFLWQVTVTEMAYK